MSGQGQWEAGGDRRSARRRPPTRWRVAVAVATLLVAALIGWALGGDEVDRGPAELEVSVDDERPVPLTPTPARPATIGGWQLTAPAPAGLDRISARVWLGDRLLVVGGIGSPQAWTYEPTTGVWRRLPDPPVRARAGVWDGEGRRAHLLALGVEAAQGALHVLTWLDGEGRWTLSPPAPRPPAEGEVLAWQPAADDGDGTLFVVGGIDLEGTPATPLALHRASWRELPTAGLPARRAPFAAWTGDALLAVGGEAWDRSPRSDGATFDPAQGRWRDLPDPPVRFGRDAAFAWTGERLLAWSVAPRTPRRPPGWSYDPDAEAWEPLPRLDGLNRHAPAVGLSADGSTLGLWGGVLWRPGGSEHDEPLVDGAVLDTAGRAWRRLPPAPLPPRGGAHVAWTDAGLLVWGGSGRSDGAVYRHAALQISEGRRGELSER